jgi:hypothetical protein
MIYTFDNLMAAYECYLNEWECPYCGNPMEVNECCCGECHAQQRQDGYECPTFEQFCKWES